MEFGTVYKQQLVNLVESFYFINLALLAGWSEYNRQGSTDYKQNQTIIIYVFTGLALFTIVIVQTFVKLRQLVGKENIKLMNWKFCQKQLHSRVSKQHLQFHMWKFIIPWISHDFY